MPEVQFTNNPRLACLSRERGSDIKRKVRRSFEEMVDFLPKLQGSQRALDTNELFYGTDGRYLVLKEISSGGGICDIYLVENQKNGKKYALKIMKSDYLKRDDGISGIIKKFFFHEIRALSMIDHKQIISMVDFGITNQGIPVIILEYIDGRTLDFYTKKLTMAEKEDIAIQLCSTISIVHQCGVVHGDIRPENVFLVNTNGPNLLRLIDFGFSWFLDPSLSIIQEQEFREVNRIFGSVVYMSPEQLTFSPANILSDIYQVGMALYNFSCGSFPFKDPYHKMNSKPLTPRLFNPYISAAFERVILKALEYNPKNRFHSAEEMKEAIEKCRDS